jgi:hypothetical protein
MKGTAIRGRWHIAICLGSQTLTREDEKEMSVGLTLRWRTFRGLRLSSRYLLLPNILRMVARNPPFLGLDSELLEGTLDKESSSIDGPVDILAAGLDDVKPGPSA